MSNNAPQSGILPNNASIYSGVHTAMYDALPPATKARVLEAKANNDLKDDRVETFIRGVITRAEAIMYDQEQEALAALKKIKKTVDRESSPF